MQTILRFFADFDEFVDLHHTLHQLEFAIPALARTTAAAAPSLDSQGLKELRFALSDLTAGLAAKLTILVTNQLVGKKVSSTTVGKAVSASIPGLLEEAFISGLLAGQAAASQRAVLLHLLSTAQVQTLGLTAKALSLPAAVAAEDDDELTSEEAAKLLHVSRSHLNTLADSGALGEIRRTAGNHRRIAKTALLAYKKLSKKRQAQGLDAIMENSQKLGLYDDELAGAPQRANR